MCFPQSSFQYQNFIYMFLKLFIKYLSEYMIYKESFNLKQ